MGKKMPTRSEWNSVKPILAFHASNEIQWLKTLLQPFTAEIARIPQVIPLRTAIAFHKE